MAGAGTTTISGALFAHLRWLLARATDEADPTRVLVIDGNAYSQLAVPGYIVAVTAVEAFVNELIFSPMARLTRPAVHLAGVPEESLAAIELLAKVVIVPKLLFGQTIPRDSGPYGDFKLLVRIRNELTHYKMSMTHRNGAGQLTAVPSRSR